MKEVIRMDTNYINDVDKNYKKCDNNEKILVVMYIFNIILNIIVAVLTKEKILLIVNYLIIILNILYVIISIFNDLILKNNAETERRKAFIANSFNVNITENKTQNYYNNFEEPSIKKMGLNSFESLLYTKNILEKMIYTNSVKIFFLLISWIVIITQISDLNIVLIFTQGLFSGEVLAEFLKLIYYFSKSCKMYEKFYYIFVTKKYEERDVPIILENVMEYECIKNYCHILLSTKIFENINNELESKWNRILQEEIKE